MTEIARGLLEKKLDKFPCRVGSKEQERVDVVGFYLCLGKSNDIYEMH